MTLKRILCALMCVLLLAAPAMAEPADADKDARIAELEAQVAELQAQVDAYHLKEIVASFDGGEVSLEEAEEVYEANVNMFAQYYGIDVAAYGMEDMLREEVVDMLAEEAVVEYMAVQLGLGLTDEQQAEFSEQAQQTYEDSVDSYYLTYLASQYEDEDEGRAAAAEAVTGMGYTYEYYLDALTTTELVNNAYEYATKDVAVSEEDIEAAYDENVAADETTYATPYQFESAFSSGVTIYYTPEGYRNVKHILFKFSDEQATRYDELSASCPPSRPSSLRPPRPPRPRRRPKPLRPRPPRPPSPPRRPAPSARSRRTSSPSTPSLTPSMPS